eukprot:1159814-Pelagomonas_calceolata.AAC.4
MAEQIEGCEQSLRAFQSCKHFADYVQVIMAEFAAFPFSLTVWSGSSPPLCKPPVRWLCASL